MGSPRPSIAHGLPAIILFSMFAPRRTSNLSFSQKPCRESGRRSEVVVLHMRDMACRCSQPMCESKHGILPRSQHFTCGWPGRSPCFWKVAGSVQSAPGGRRKLAQGFVQPAKFLPDLKKAWKGAENGWVPKRMGCLCLERQGGVCAFAGPKTRDGCTSMCPQEGAVSAGSISVHSGSILTTVNTSRVGAVQPSTPPCQSNTFIRTSS